MFSARITYLPLLKKKNDVLHQAVTIQIVADDSATGLIRCRISNPKHTAMFNLGKAHSGASNHEILLPAVEAQVMNIFEVSLGGESVTINAVQKKVRQWEIFLVLHSHTDLGFTAPISDVMKIHNENTDLALQFIEETKDWDVPSRFKWTCEVTWQVENYIRENSQDKVARLMEQVRKGNVSIAGFYTGQLTELLGHEQAARCFYLAAQLRRKYGISIDTAMLCDVPGCTWGFVQILAKSGIKNLIVADNNFIAPFLCRTDLPRPFIWEGQDGSDVLAWFTDHPFFAYIEAKNYGIAESYEATKDKLPAKLLELEANGYPFNEFQLQYAFDNFKIEFQPAEVVKQWNETWEYPKLRLSTAGEFLNGIREKYYSRLQKRKGDWANWWANIVTDYPSEMKKSRYLHNLVPVLETMNTSLQLTDNKAASTTDAFNKIYSDTLAFDEHSGSGMIWDSKDDAEQDKALREGFGYIENAGNSTELIRNNILSAIQRILNNDTTVDVLHLFNPSNFRRDELLTFDLPEAYKDCEIRDSQSGQIVGRVSNNQAVIVGAGIAPLSSKNFTLTSGTASFSADKHESVIGDQTIENAFYRVIVSAKDGGLRSIFDKTLKKELTDKTPYAFNRLVYYIPEKTDGIIMGTYTKEAYEGIPVPGEANCVLPADEIRISRTELHGLSKSVTVSHYIDGTCFMSQCYTLPASGHLVISNTFENGFPDNMLIPSLRKKYLGKTGMLYLSFPFNLPGAEIEFESTDGIINPGNDQFKGTNYDFHAMQNWLLLCNREMQINFSSRDVPLFDIGEMSLMKYRHQLTGKHAHLFFRIFALQPEHYQVNSPYKMGESLTLTFAFNSLAMSGTSDRNEAAKFGQMINTPVIHFIASQGDENDVSPEYTPFEWIKPESIRILTYKKAESGQGYILRVQESIGRETIVRVGIRSGLLKNVYHTRITEELLAPVPVVNGTFSYILRPSAIETFLIIEAESDQYAGEVI